MFSEVRAVSPVRNLRTPMPVTGRRFQRDRKNTPSRRGKREPGHPTLRMPRPAPHRSDTEPTMTTTRFTGRQRARPHAVPEAAEGPASQAHPSGIRCTHSADGQDAEAVEICKHLVGETDSGRPGQEHQGHWGRNVRHRGVGKLRDWGFPSLTDRAELLISELVTNACQHGGGCRSVVLFRTVNGVRVEVRQASGSSPRLRQAGVDEERGRGMVLVDRLADAWGVAPDGTVVWFALSLEGGES
ncbi:ATP-binding protein [Actinacidiphila sp. ITFR-21]|uniref:ATP-binding protein n=1 Tax=Actinacidiphila sp. ITFR-21 TaxID=3075199 RepID=UPI0037D9D81C